MQLQLQAHIIDKMYLRAILFFVTIPFLQKYCHCSNPCSDIDKCGKCIQNPECGWCLDEAKRTRCLPETTTECRSKLITGKGTEYIEVLKDEPLSSMNPSVQIKPQKISLNIPNNHSYSIKFEFARAWNSLDLYFLTDNSKTMAPHREMLSSLGNTLMETMAHLTTDFKMGYGSFVDKRISPFGFHEKKILTCDQRYSYMNHLRLTNDTTDFQKAVNERNSSCNLDGIEGGLDALAQVLVCGDEIGWRHESTHIVVLSTDAELHIAGDGKFGGVSAANDGRCHMSAGEYLADQVMDYPSVSHIGHLMEENNIYVIFAIVCNMTETMCLTYEELPHHTSKELAKFAYLDLNSTNVVTIINDTYHIKEGEKMSTGTTFIAFLIVFNVGMTRALIAYDCQNQGMNITTFSLTEIGACKTPSSRVKESQEMIQLVQLHEIEMIPIYQCKIHVTRLISHCGMHSHMSAVTNGLATFIYPTSRVMCLEMHQTRRLMNFYGKTLDDLVINGTTHATVLMAGRMNAENVCQGGDYEDHKGRWTNVIAQAALEITLHQRIIPARVAENQVIMPGGVSCPYKEKSCVDSIYGHSYWDHVDESRCSTEKYDVLFEGTAKKMTPVNLTLDNYDTIVYTVDKGETLFAMPTARPTMICGQSAYETDHPRFFIIKPSENGRFYFSKGKMNLFNMDPTTYVNTKIVFIEKHIQGQLTSLYADVIAQRCALEQQVLRNLQTLAVTAPMEFAFAKMKVPGYMAVNYGEVVHVLQCAPVEVKIRHMERCYHELPIVFENRTYFMSPRSHVMQKYGTEVGCNPFLYPAYKLGERWYKVSRNLHEIPVPQIMEPNNEHKWSYTNPNNLFAGGLYTQEDMEKLRKLMMLPTERKAVQGMLARIMAGLSTDMQGTNINGLVTQDTIKTWVLMMWESVFTWFTVFGTISSGFIGAYMLLRSFKFLVDTIVHGLVLYEMFGWSIRLIGAVWDSVTMFCIHKQQQQQKQQNNGTAASQKQDNQAIEAVPNGTNNPSAPQVCIEMEPRIYPVAENHQDNSNHWN